MATPPSEYSTHLDWIFNFGAISRRGGKAFAIKTMDSGSIRGRVKPKTIKIGILSLIPRPKCSLALLAKKLGE